MNNVPTNENPKTALQFLKNSYDQMANVTIIAKDAAAFTNALNSMSYAIRFLGNLVSEADRIIEDQRSEKESKEKEEALRKKIAKEFSSQENGVGDDLSAPVLT